MAKAIQDCIPDNHCFGCGPLNPLGLQIKSYWDGEEAVCRFQPRREHMAGPTHVLNGGILATVIDCHAVCTAIADSYRVAGEELGAVPFRWAVTAALRVDYLAPTPIHQPVELRARVREVSGRKRVVDCTVRSGGRDCAKAEVLAVEVPEGWRQSPGR
ncbi:MAG TPA: PaaI family thioesterase [Anaeromyxobacteraceae bacterium]|nr:PaaI family thioesterase [Anaeromyxobacteraceae bacterium]